MAFQFPPNPIIGQEYTPSAGITYRWSGLAWFLVNSQFITKADADALYIALTQKAAANGVATLDAGAQVPANQLGNMPAQPVRSKFSAQVGTYNVPAGATRLHFILIGGGSSGSGSGTGANGGFSNDHSIFGVHQANAGTPGNVTGAPAAGGLTTVPSAQGIAIQGGSGGGQIGTADTMGGAGGGSSVAQGAPGGFGGSGVPGRGADATLSQYGAGGGGAGAGTATPPGGGGGGGATLDDFILGPLDPTYAFSIPNIVAGGSPGGNGEIGGAGGPGLLLVTAYFD